MPGLSASQWKDKLAEIASFLQRPTSLCLIGSAAGMFGGQPNRMSIDLDTLQRASKFGYADLKQACERAGLLFNPQEEMEPDVPYIQLVEEGIVQVGKFSDTTPMFTEGQLVIVRPPMENVIASKLLRASPKDLEDIAFLLARYHVTPKAVAAVIEHFPYPHKETAQENLVYLAALSAPDI
jgi:hypothetical protein